MNSFVAAFFCLAIASASAGHLGLGGYGGLGGLGGHGGFGGLGGLGGNGGFGGFGGGHAVAVPVAVAPVNPAAHIPSGSISVGANGAVVAGPAGSVRTDNGLHGHGAGVNVAGPAGDVRTQGGHAVLSGPGIGGHGGLGGHGGFGGAGVGLVAAPVAVGLGGAGAWGPGAGLVGGHGGFFGAHGLVGHGHGHGW